MDISRREILKQLIEKFAQTAHSMHSGQCFSFGNFLLTKQQIMILFFVYKNKGSASVKEIANFLQVTPGAVTQFVDALVKKKIIKREENTKDRRGINIKLIPSMEKKIKNFEQCYIENISQAFVIFSDADLLKFIQLLEKIDLHHFQKKKNLI